MNSITLTGNLVREWSVKEISNGVLAKNTLAVNEKYNGETKTTIIDIITFNDQQVEVLTKFTSKGSKLLVVGKLDINTYTGKCKECKADKSVREAQVKIFSFEFLSTRDKDFNDVGVQDSSAKAWTKEKPKATIDDDIFSSATTVEITDGDLPF